MEVSSGWERCAPSLESVLLLVSARTILKHHLGCVRLICVGLSSTVVGKKFTHCLESHGNYRKWRARMAKLAPRYGILVQASRSKTGFRTPRTRTWKSPGSTKTISKISGIVRKSSRPLHAKACFSRIHPVVTSLLASTETMTMNTSFPNMCLSMAIQMPLRDSDLSYR